MKKQELFQLLLKIFPAKQRRGFDINSSKDILIQKAKENGLLDKEYTRGKDTRTHPRVVTATNILTGEVQKFKSIYAGAKALNVGVNAIVDRNGKLLRKTYLISLS